MPLYEYQCRKCEKRFELLVRSDDQPVCPECGSKELTKLFSTPAVHTSGGSDPTGPACPYSGTSKCEPGSCPLQ